MTIEGAFARFVGEDCVIYMVSSSGTSLNYSIIECKVEEIGDGWIRISEPTYEDEPTDESIVNIANIVRIKKHPLNKKGKKKMII